MKYAFLLLIFLNFAQCITAPKRESKLSSAIGIKILTRDFLKPGILFHDSNQKFPTVFIIRISDSVIINEINDNLISMTSDGISANNLYNFNIEPGKYAIVAVHERRNTGTSKNPFTVSILHLFSSESVKLSQFDISENEFKFLGELYLNNSKKWGLEGADSAQKHYCSLIASQEECNDNPKKGIDAIFDENTKKYYIYKSTIQKIIKNNKVEYEFFKDTNFIFKESNWTPLIKRRLKDLESKK